MNAQTPELSRSQRAFFGFLLRRFLMGTVISLSVAGLFLLFDLGGIKSMMFRAEDTWHWVMVFCFDIWVTVTGITIAVGIWYLGDWRDPPR